LAPEAKNFALKFPSILPTRRWTLGSLEYSCSPIAGDFIHARKSSHSASFSIVMGFSFTETTTSWVIGFLVGGPERKSPS
jgi:hypothetical protein